MRAIHCLWLVGTLRRQLPRWPGKVMMAHSESQLVPSSEASTENDVDVSSRPFYRGAIVCYALAVFGLVGALVIGWMDAAQLGPATHGTPQPLAPALKSDTGYSCPCTSDSVDVLSSCCASFPERVGSKGIVKARMCNNTGNDACGFLNCTNGDFVGYSCQSMPRCWSQGLHKQQEVPVLRTLDDTSSVFGPTGAAHSEFPNPKDFTASRVESPAVPSLAGHGPELAPTPRFDRNTREDMNQQALCAGYITTSVTYLSGLALQIKGLDYYCKTDPEAVERGQRFASGEEKPGCVRSVMGVAGDLGYISYFATASAGVCGQPDKADPCGESITNLLATSFTIAQASAQMAIRDQEQYEGAKWAAFGYTFAVIAGNIEQFGEDISEAARVCVPGDRPKEDPGADLDYGACVGQIIGSVAYIAAGALQLTGAVEDEDDYYYAGPVATGFGAANSLTLAANQADSAAASCGGPDQACGEDITTLVAALFMALKALGVALKDCHQHPEQPEGFQFQALCTATIGQIVIGAATMADSGSLAGADCATKVAFPDNAECGSAVSAVFATFADLAVSIAHAYNQCKEDSHGYSPYMCAQSAETAAGDGLALSEAVGEAQESCPFVNTPEMDVPPGDQYSPASPIVSQEPASPASPASSSRATKFDKLPFVIRQSFYQAQPHA